MYAKLVSNAACIPLPPTSWPDVEPVEVVSNSPQRLALAAPFRHERQNFRRWTLGSMRRHGQSPRLLDARIAEPGATALGFGQRRLGPLRDHLPLVLGHSGKDVNGQPVGLGHIAGNEVGPALHQIGDEGHVAGEPVKAGDQQGRAALAALIERGQELRPVRVPPSALDLGELSHELAAVDLAGDGLTLRVKAEAARALAIRGNAVIGDKTGRRSGHVQILNGGLDLYMTKTRASIKYVSNVYFGITAPAQNI